MGIYDGKKGYTLSDAFKNMPLIDECAFCPDYTRKSSYGVEQYRCCNEKCRIVKEAADDSLCKDNSRQVQAASGSRR